MYLWESKFENAFFGRDILKMYFFENGYFKKSFLRK